MGSTITRDPGNWPWLYFTATRGMPYLETDVSPADLEVGMDLGQYVYQVSIATCSSIIVNIRTSLMLSCIEVKLHSYM